MPAFLRVAPVALVCLASSSNAFGQTDPATARALFDEARTLMKSDQYELACPKLEESRKLDDGMGTQFNLAHCWEKQGRTASAWALFLDVAAAARASNQGRREEVARSRAAHLSNSLSRLRIDFPAAPVGAVLTRNGTPVGRAAWSSATPVDPGQYVIVASAPGHASWTQTVDVKAGENNVDILVPALQVRPAANSNDVDQGTGSAFPVRSDLRMDSGTGLATQQWFGVGLAGAGFVGLAAGAVFGLRFLSLIEKSENLCTAGPEGQDCIIGIDDPGDVADQKAYAADAKNSQIYGFVSAGVGGAALLAGALLYWNTSEPQPADNSAWLIEPLWTREGPVGAQLSTRF